MLYFDIFGQHAADKLAFIFKGQEMIYGELRHKIEQWANYLQAQGVERGDKVGLFSKNCTNFVVAYFAIIKAGGVVVPFNFQLAARECNSLRVISCRCAHHACLAFGQAEARNHVVRSTHLV